MKSAVIFLLLLQLCFIPAVAQDPAGDPLSKTYIIQNGGGDELVTMNYRYPEVKIYKYYKALEKFANDTLLETLSWSGEGNGPSSDMDVSDLDRDNLDEIITAWFSNKMVKLAVLKVDPAKMFVDPVHGWKKISLADKPSPLAYQPSNWMLITDIFVRAANLDADSTGEFVVAYWAEGGKVEIAAYDLDSSLNITAMGTIRDQLVNEPPKLNLCEDQTSLFHMECADFNGDGIDEILLTGRAANVPNGWNIFANVYAWNQSSKSLQSLAKKAIYTQSDPVYDIGNINSKAGFFHSPGKESAVVSIFQYNVNAYGDGVTRDSIANILLPLSMDDQLNAITSGAPVFQRQTMIPPECYYERTSTLTACDMNNDGREELVSAFAFNGVLPTLKIYRGGSVPELTLFANLDGVAENFYGSMEAGDFYRDSTDGPQKAELIITTRKDWYEWTGKMYRVLSRTDGSFDKLELIDSGRQYGLGVQKKTLTLAGNFDRDIRIGKPKRYSFTEILQPLVILNAPPIHFDIFGGQIYDVCRSYNNYTSEFVAKYIKETQQMTELRTEMNRDWSLSADISAGFSFWGASVSAHLSQTYGEKFSKVAGSSRTVTVGFEIDATVDDQIYATVMDYDMWEYPVYGSGKLEGHVLVVEPQIVKNSWFDSKSWKGYSYIPNHEVGNILSYRRYPMLSDNPLMVEKIKGDYGLQTSFLLSRNSSYGWFLSFKDFTENQVTTTKEFSRDWGVSLSGWGSGVSLDGSYNSEDINTQRTTVQSGIDLSVHMASVDMSIGETRYEVTPYAYWASNGALVIDYAVSPELSGPGGEDTWWDTRYGYFSDPAFILPWRYDPEKGSAISEAKRKQTNDIQFYPQDPADGDTITIRTQVSNFSLLPTPVPIGIRFFLGDPSNGGTPIESLSGVSEVYTNGVIPPRGSATVEMRWKVPHGTPKFPRIYAVLDAGNKLMEIHENNNVSWNILQKTTGSVINEVQEVNNTPEFNMAYNYPNPFDGSTRILFTLPTAGDVNISVYNPLGQKIETLVDRAMTEGFHTVEFNGMSNPSGIYFCMIRSGGYQKVIKMVKK